MACKSILKDSYQGPCDCSGEGLIRRFVRDEHKLCSCPARVAPGTENELYINSCCKTVWANLRGEDQPKFFEELKCAMLDQNDHSHIKQLGAGSFGTVVSFKYKGCDYTFKLQIQQRDRTDLDFSSDLQNEVSITQFLSNNTAYKNEEAERPAANSETNRLVLDIWKWNGTAMVKKTGVDIFQLFYPQSASYVPFYIGELRFPMEGTNYNGILSHCRPAVSGLKLWEKFQAKRAGWSTPNTGLLSREELRDICILPWQALFAIHLRGVLHLDIKPANMVFHCEAPGYKLTGFKFIDFGLSQYCDAAGSQPGDRLLDPSTKKQQKAKCSPTYQNAKTPLECTGWWIQGTPMYSLAYAAFNKFKADGELSGGLERRNYYDANERTPAKRMKNTVFYDYTQLDDIHALNLSLREFYTGLEPNQEAIANQTLKFIVATIKLANIYTDINAILLSFFNPDLEEGGSVAVKKKSIYETHFSIIFDAVMAEAAKPKKKQRGGTKRKTKKYRR